MKRLNGKVAVITGGARGMGACHARKLSEEGAKVVITDILVEEGEALARELGENAKFMKHDVRNVSEWDDVIAETEAIFGPINVLVNNAGILLREKIEDCSEESYRNVIDINQVSVFLGMKAVFPSMRRAKGGSIINISSLNGFATVEETIAYTASKFAVRGMTKTAALEFGEYGIRVNSVHPGIIDTPIFRQLPKEQLEARTKTIPLKRMAPPEEVSNLILFLASDESSYSTGSEFLVEGGVLARY